MFQGRNSEADARGHRLRRGARLPHQAARHHAARREGHRAARASDAGAYAAPARQRRRGDERHPGEGRCGRADALLRRRRGQPADRERGGRRPHRHHAAHHRRPRAPRAASRFPAGPACRYADPADRRGRDLLLPAHARARPAGRARQHHSHPRRLEDLDRRHGAEGARQGREPRQHRHAHPPRAGEERPPGDGEDRKALHRGWESDQDPPGRAAVVLYVSTRGNAPPRRFADILLEGLAPDGGLYVPENYPPADLASLRGKSYSELAHAILAQFMDGVPDLKRIVESTYTKNVFGTDDITPLKTLEPGFHLLGRLFEGILQQNNLTLNILGATSGDTGSAAEHALRGKRGIQVFMLSPHGRMSPFQRAQMYALQDANIHNLAVKGVFDDCQDLVKEVNADRAFKAKQRIGAVNSINWARVAAQVIYYFKGYFAAKIGRAHV